MSTKRIILSIGMLVFVAAVVVSGTGAFFSDTETSTGNVFTAGAIDLKIDSEQHYNGNVCENVGGGAGPIYQWTGVAPYPVPGSACTGSWDLKDLGQGDIVMDQFFNFDDIKPGDEGENTISLHVINNDAWVCADVSNLTDYENDQTEPEAIVDTTTGTNEGELSSTMLWKVWRDDADGIGATPGDNIYQDGEVVLNEGTHPSNEMLAIYDASTGTGPLAGDTTGYIGMSWSLPADSGNETQTDSMTGDITFTVVQSRNNDDFVCGDTSPSGDVVVSSNDLAQSFEDISTDSWFFYNDTNDTVMTTDQFSGTSGENHMDTTAGSDGAYMKLGTETNPRYNIATYQFKNVPLATLSSLKYRVYDASTDSSKPFLNFNVDFDNSDNWQNRLVYVPTTLPVGAWTEVDAIQGGAAMWRYSGAFWPASGTETGTTPGTTPKSWTSILADYPSAETRSTDSWFGVRVGEPGPAAAEANVDWVEFNGIKYDFTI